MFEVAPVPASIPARLPVRPSSVAVQARPLRKRISEAEWLLLLSFALCILDGAIRKWVLRDTESLWKYAPYFAKDVVLIGLVLSCKPLGEVRSAKTLSRFLAIGLTISAIGVGISLLVNWSSLSPVGGLLTVRSLILLPLLALFSVPRLRGFNIERLAILLGFFTMVNAALGAIQYTSPQDARINYYASQQYETVVFGENVRAMGTFSYITGFSTMAVIGAWAGLVLMSHAVEKKRYLWIGFLVYALGLWCAVLSISRAPTIIIIALFFAWLFSTRRVLGNLIGVGLVVGVFALLLVFTGRFSVIENATDVLMARHAESEETVAGRATLPINEIAEASSTAPFGAGFGSEQVGGVFADTGIMSFRTFEGQFARLIMEAGIIGVAGFLIVCLGLLKALYDAKKSARTEALRRTIIITIALAGLMFYGNVIFDHVASFFVWAIGAAVLASVSEQTHVVSQAHR
jgi:hypothetical protein